MLFSKKIRCKSLAVNLMFFLLAPSGWAAEETVEFNIDALDLADRDNIDLSRFSEENYVPAATYLLDVKINGRSYRQEKITYIVSPDNKEKTLACLRPDMIKALALKPKAEKLVRVINESCSDITTITGVSVKNQGGALDLIIPQAWMKYSDPDWVPPERWNVGIPGIFLDYNVSGQTSRQIKNGHSSNTNFSTYGQVGVNMGAWRLRGQYQGYYSGNEGQHNFEVNQVYAYRPLLEQAAKLTLGEIYSNSNVFEMLRFTGINLVSDERMLPPNLQGYAPEVRGIANSNATVTISQGGHTLYETTVPAGPFNIQDLNTAVRGELDVKVEEQDGTVTSFKLNTANIPYLTRPGYIRYNTSIGKPSLYNHKMQGPAFYTGDASWGFSNSWSLYGGLLLSGRNYNAWSAGAGRDLDVFGAISADVTQSFSKVRDEGTQQGMSFKLSYSKTFDRYNSTITFAGYRFSEKKYRTQSQFLNERYGKGNNSGYDKDMYTITANKTFWADDPEKMTTLYLNYTHQNYWDRKGQDSYGLSIARSFDIADIRDITANFALYRSTYDGRKNDSLAFSVSVPIGTSRWAGYDMQLQGRDNTHMLSYNDYTDQNNTWRVRSGISQRGRTAFDGYYEHRAMMAEIDTNVSVRQEDYIAFGGSVRGGITATRHGVAIHNSSAMQDTARVMVDTGGIANVPLNHRKTRTNMFGIGVVPDIVSYSNFDTRIDVDSLSENIEVNQAIATSTYTEGAIGYEKFAVAQGKRMLAQVRLSDGQPPPFGTEVFNADGVNVAMVMEGGIAYFSGVNPGEKLFASWSGKRQCTIQIPNQELDTQTQILLPCQ